MAAEAGHSDPLAEAILLLKDKSDTLSVMERRARELFEGVYEKPIAIKRRHRALIRECREDEGRPGLSV